MRADAPTSVILKRAHDASGWGVDVAILDVQTAVGYESAVDAVVERICAIASKCVLHVGKSISAARAHAAMEDYYAAVLGVPPLAALPAECLHPFYGRDGVARPYVSLRDIVPWWKL